MNIGRLILLNFKRVVQMPSTSGGYLFLYDLAFLCCTNQANEVIKIYEPNNSYLQGTFGISSEIPTLLQKWCYTIGEHWKELGIFILVGTKLGAVREVNYIIQL